jgi:ABC-2 type transport system permease protein
VTAILALTSRQLAGSRRLWLVLALVALPVLAAVLYRVADSTTPPNEFADQITANLIASGILPLVMLLFGTSAFGNELGDRTLVYLVLKPVPRWRIAVPKFVASVLVGGVPVAASGAVAVAIIENGDLGGAAATGIGLLIGSAAYAAVFTWAGLALRHALIFGLVYVVIWEAVLAAYLDGIRYLSIRQFTLAIIGWLDSEQLATRDLSLGGAGGAIGAAVVIGVFSVLTARKLARIDVP